MWGVLCDERTDLSFTTAAGPRQYSQSRVRVPRDSRSYFTVSESRLPQPEGPGPSTPGREWLRYIPRHRVRVSSPSTTRRSMGSYSHTPQHERSFRLLTKVRVRVRVRVTSRLEVYRQTHWGSRPDFFLQLNPYGHSPYVTSSLTRRWGCLLWICLAGLSSSVRIALIAFHWKSFLVHLCIYD
jgi:hypothetical protein